MIWFSPRPFPFNSAGSERSEHRQCLPPFEPFFEIWINDDSDDGDIASGDSDLPGQDENEANWSDDHVNGRSDLTDFFPVWLDIGMLATNRPNRTGTGMTYRLSQADSALKFVYTDLTRDQAGAYLTNDVTGLHFIGDDSLEIEDMHEATTVLVPDEGVKLSDLFINTISQDPEKGVILLEGICETTNSLVLEALVETNVVCRIEMPLSLSSVTNMYHFKNLRADGAGRADALGSPANYPDSETSGKDFVFVHGYNVDASSGDATHSEVFKRMVQSGYQGKFWGVSWYGDPPALANAHYQNAVVEAFAHAPELRSFLETFSSPPDLAAHSLGNGVVGIALNDASGSGNLINNYFALDAAMALEAYGEVANSTNMVCGEPFTVAESPYPGVPGIESSWPEYPEDVWASEWHELFDASDSRSELTWRNRIAGAVDRVEFAYNFYSSTEEVLRVDENCRSYWATLQNWRFEWPPADAGYYAWQIQEWYKGTSSFIPSVLAGGASDQAGWGIVEDNTSMNMDYNMSYGYMLRSFSWVEDQLSTNEAAYKAALKSDPFFKHEPEILFSSSGSSFVSGVVQDYSSHLDYTLDSVGLVQVRDWLLAKAFPARSRPMGSTFAPVGHGWTMNYDMSSPTVIKKHGWPRTTTLDDEPEWRHGDFKDIAYLYVQELYKKWIELSR